jgi:hypothetical protein
MANIAAIATWIRAEYSCVLSSIEHKDSNLGGEEPTNSNSGLEGGGTPPATHEHKRVYRTVSTVRASWGATAVMIGLVVLAVVPGKAQLFGVIFGIPWLIATWRAWILGVYVEPACVRIVQYVTSRRVPWEDIDRFAVMPAGNYPFAGYIVLRAKHRPIVLAGMGAAARPNPEAKRLQVQRPIDELNEILEEWRQAAGRPLAESGPARLPRPELPLPPT